MLHTIFSILGLLVLGAILYGTLYKVRAVKIKKAIKMIAGSKFGTMDVTRATALAQGYAMSPQILFDRHQTINFSNMATTILNRRLSEIKNIKNMFKLDDNWVYGSEFICIKIKGIVAEKIVENLDQKINALTSERSLIIAKYVLRGIGVHNADRNKILAGISSGTEPGFTSSTLPEHLTKNDDNGLISILDEVPSMVTKIKGEVQKEKEYQIRKSEKEAQLRKWLKMKEQGKVVEETTPGETYNVEDVVGMTLNERFNAGREEFAPPFVAEPIMTVEVEQTIEEEMIIQGDIEP